MSAVFLLRDELNSNLACLMNSSAAFDEALFSEHTDLQYGTYSSLPYRTVVIRKSIIAKTAVIVVLINIIVMIH